MPSMLFDNVRLILPGEGIAPGRLLVEDGTITAVNPPAAACPADAERIDGGGRLLGPGLIDIHSHGIHTFLFEDADGLRAGAAVLPAYGATCALPTLVPRMGPSMLADMEQVAEAIPGVAGACVPGLHLEGPFMALTGAGCVTQAGDVGLLEECIAACHGRMAVMSISPDTPHILPVIERLVEHGILPFITHTRASVEQTEAAIAAGARHATHFYDVFHVPEETEPGARPVGAVETILADPRVSVDFIADGVHVHPMAIRATLAAKGYQGVMLITDANIGAGLPEGEYETRWGYRVYVKPGHGARVAAAQEQAGVLAGSALTMNAGIANLLQWLPIPPAQVWAMGTSNPARLLGLHHKGVLAEGADADFVLWDDDLAAWQTWIAGKCAYSRQ